ncbi:MAG TPA: bifunctional 2-methylcitrate synthase/citrate synthase [Myxococcota bacterium]|nr:bifunctional 2-methylcitrate synthase/citrate synthase [Myxococcota bacterium]HQK52123.1 bifunctional 2-methylcitrate synthase/citrate synthase [Myxococcota bacterium]
MADETRQAPEVHKGLEGVVADVTSISQVVPETCSLTYRGHPVPELAESCEFDEVAWLLWHGDLPGRADLEAFRQAEVAARPLSPILARLIRSLPRQAHPMDVVRAAVSVLGMGHPDAPRNDSESLDHQGLQLLAQVPTVIAAFHRLRQGQRPIAPRPDLGRSANFFWMVFGEVPDPTIVRAFDVSLILYAEHGFNASTFTARVVTSTMADLHGAVTAAIAALKGPLHGGANEAVMRTLAEIGEVANVRPWLDRALAERRRIMGFGHRVYGSGDSRVPTMRRWGLQVAKARRDRRWYDIADALEAEMAARKHLHPNLDFPSGPAYHLMGFPWDLFTPIFVMSRLAGWIAHVREQAAANRLIRHLAAYVGPEPRPVPALDMRRPLSDDTTRWAPP